MMFSWRSGIDATDTKNMPTAEQPNYRDCRIHLSPGLAIPRLSTQEDYLLVGCATKPPISASGTLMRISVARLKEPNASNSSTKISSSEIVHNKYHNVKGYEN